MTGRGVILYGPPAAGKDTITAALLPLDDRYEPYQRLKVGPGRTSGYRVTTTEHLAELEDAGAILYRNTRYGATYATDRPGLDHLVSASRIPIVHVGQVNAIDALMRYPLTWLRVLLWCPRTATEARSRARGDTDTAARLTAWDATLIDLDSHPDSLWDVSVDTSRTAPAAAAALIDKARRGEEA